MISHYTVAVPVLGLVFGGVLRIAGSAIEPDPIVPGIEIHSLTFTNSPAPAILQDRTVTAEAKLTARWEAYVSRSIEGQEVKLCEGGGWWDYGGGRRKPAIEINEWVGESTCWQDLPLGVEFQACATYSWGDGETDFACSQKFKKESNNG